MKDEQKKAVLRRLKIASGQMGGLEKMIEEDRYCVEVLTQVAAIQEALRGVSRIVLEGHLDSCVRHAFENGEGEAHIREISDIIFKLNR
jgi:DNA-binding FrmR family transcriptional regulator